MSNEPRRALLDTSVLIDPPSAQQVSQHADELAVSVIAIAELQYGVTAATDPLEQTRRRQRIQNILDQFDVLPFDVPTAEYYGVMATLIRQHGRNPRARRMDLQIAATAVRHGLALLTRNIDDFAGLESAVTVIGLPDHH
jgi:predicted nucleic acid-binding protein